ncbi:type VII secretion protein EccB [Mycobacterium sp. CPCC 205372]|uniref:Type VII secretion protein EccB n=1 Tax=Mycobacterium hippophais TaxID=3016340 RepID=A0ABT4PUD4_9MYCO|nr:type VII secretion protein EccB [Mycobacterium hippophais]MCZ8380185.1 type VII secretion protein EccB [Mycobacterium hippophais]
MPAPITTRAQVNGYRFLLRRLEHALIRGDSRMIHDPMRGQKRSLLVGLVLGIVIVGACAILAFFKPQPSVGDAQILLSESNGALFVRIGDRAHPALNLASARLIAGSSDKPAAVDDRKLSALERGPLVGIVGAPTTIAGGDDMATSHWTVCDTTTSPAAVDSTGSRAMSTTVLANPPVLSGEVHAAGDEEAVLVEADGAAYLLYGGVRAPVDLADPVLVAALHLTGAEPRSISPGLLNAFSLVPPVTAVTVPGAGAPAPAPLPESVRVGSVIRTTETSGERLFVVLADGIQPVTPATADIIRYGDPTAEDEPEAVSPALLTGLPQVSGLAVAHYPERTPELAAVDAAPVVCFGWARGNTEGTARAALLVGRRLPIPDRATTVPLATGDGSGPATDAVYLKAGTGEYIRAVGGEPDAGAMGQLFYVTDTGQRYHIRDAGAAKSLGVQGVADPTAPPGDATLPQLAPWPVLSLLPPGPELSQQAALIAHDGIAADPRGRGLNPPSN